MVFLLVVQQFCGFPDTLNYGNLKYSISISLHRIDWNK